jgi:D-glycero-D-manno-heptose 1,7-bisphosphate phosphatase
MKRAAFVDRDGTLNEMVFDATHGLLDSPRRPEQVTLVKNARGFLEGLRALGFFIVIVTNQPGISKGTLTLPELDAVNQRLADLLEPAGWDDLRFCPHHPDFGSPCDCRKPLPGMLTKAATDHGIDLSQSWMIGDGQVDIAAGRAAGCKTMLVSKLKISQVEKFFDTNGAEPDAVAPNLMAALDIIAGRATTKKARE